MADLRHTRDPDARPDRRPVLVAAPLALAATASVVTLGIAMQGPGDAGDARDREETAAAPAAATSSQAAADPTEADTDAAAAQPSATPEGAERAPILSRSDARGLGPLQLVKKPNLMSRVATRQAIHAAKKSDSQLWVTDDLNLWTRPGKDADETGELDAGRQVLVTGRQKWGRVEVVFHGKPLWVSDGYLSEDKPLGLGAGISDAPCPDGSVENGLTDSAVLVYRTVCHAFPQITSYGGWDAHGEHASGKAIDIMTSDVTLGTAIADFLRAHAAELNLYDVIWRQRIFTQERGAEGWRGMPSRGSATANHYDHVHVSTN